MNFVWQNLRKRGQNKAAIRSLERLVSSPSADLVLLQETFARRILEIDRLAHTVPIYVSRDLSAFVGPAIGNVAVFCDEPFVLGLTLNALTVLNVHLSAYQGAKRSQQLECMLRLLDKSINNNIVIGGDFNLAPYDRDGLFNGAFSSWTLDSERRVLRELMKRHGLFDVLGESPPQEFTIERHLRGGLVQFRCDFILCSEALRSSAQASYIHEARTGSWAFTDHSGMRLSLETRK
ncbi:Endonuclease/exonuclease/phosphatase [Rhodopseudomonas palustris HaA2]|uniref:Endonuclease/exonuclease/phosphatase n=1 Tax=Rhodopseudomonas palustris (strain HaA2) TaxID=316058 RepID=Q2IRI0_RHOP2|nr:Endonuclease/exonuclease/phosphatase [Rhodopseudomonas palustris HaA2]